MRFFGVFGLFTRWSSNAAGAIEDVVEGFINWVRGILVRPVRVMGGNMVHRVRVTAIPAVDKLNDVYAKGKD
jgi:hypothetical protein